MTPLSLSDVLALTGGAILGGPGDAMVTGFASLREAQPGDLSFLRDRRHAAQLARSAATVVLVPPDFDSCPPRLTCVAVADPSRAFQALLDRYQPPAAPFLPGVHPSAVVHASAEFDRSRVSIGAQAVVEEGVTLGDGSEVGPGAVVGRGSIVGAAVSLRARCVVHHGSRLGARVTLHSGVVIGADGFGYEFKDGRHHKVPQLGTVEIDADVEIGAGTMVDRARVGRTRIGEGTKIDNLVQIGHNVVIGRHCIIVAGTMIAGSAIIGDYVVIGGQAAIGGHVTVGAQARLGARCGVTKDLPGGASYLGFPAVPAREEWRQIASARRVPELLQRLATMEQTLARLQADRTSVEKAKGERRKANS